MVDHPFGGPWTEIKLDAVQYCLECYAKALTPKNLICGTSILLQARETALRRAKSADC